MLGIMHTIKRAGSAEGDCRGLPSHGDTLSVPMHSMQAEQGGQDGGWCHRPRLAPMPRAKAQEVDGVKAPEVDGVEAPEVDGDNTGDQSL